MEIQIVEDGRQDRLLERVSRLVAEGWKMQGGVSAYSSAGSRIYMLTLVRNV